MTIDENAKEHGIAVSRPLRLLRIAVPLAAGASAFAWIVLPVESGYLRVVAVLLVVAGVVPFAATAIRRAPRDVVVGADGTFVVDASRVAPPVGEAAPLPRRGRIADVLVPVCALMLLALVLAGRGLRRHGREQVGDSLDCAPRTLPSGAVARGRSGGGIAGRAETVTVYDDGRVVKYGWRPEEDLQVHTIPTDRVKKLAADLGATGVFGVRSGCWFHPPHADAAFATLTLRREGRIYQYDLESGTPSEVWAASHLVATLGRELRDPPRAAAGGSP